MCQDDITRAQRLLALIPLFLWSRVPEVAKVRKQMKIPNLRSHSARRTATTAMNKRQIPTGTPCHFIKFEGGINGRTLQKGTNYAISK